MTFHVVTLFPEVVDAYAQASILGRAQKDKKLLVKTYQLRDFVRKPPASAGRRGTGEWFYRRVDDKPYGGGPGMVLQAEPVVRAVDSIQSIVDRKNKKLKTRDYKLKTDVRPPRSNIKVLITSAGGKPLTNAYARRLAKEKNVVIICGRYEGIDARVKKALRAEEVSVGPYILTGGEVPALAIIDATARQIPGVLGKMESLEEERVASHDVYTRPETVLYKGKKYRVPKVLLSGHHAQIDAQRAKRRSLSQ